MNKIGQERRALLKSFLYAFRGVRFCVKSERNMRIHLAAGFRQVDTDGDCCVMEYRW